MRRERIKRKALHDESGARILTHSSSTTSTDSLPPTFSLHYMRLNTGYCLTRCTEPERAAFASRIREMSQLTWVQIKGSQRHGQGCEEIPQRQIRGSSIPKGVHPDAALLSFRCIGKHPMVGFREGQTFHIIWIDRDSSLYRHS